MSQRFAGLLTRRNRYIDSIFIDAFLRESHQSEVSITEFPVEFGININDHRVILPKVIEIEGAVSNMTPLIFGASFKVPDFVVGSNTSRATQAWKNLLLLQQTGEPFDVQTGLITYKNMVIQSLRADRDKFTSGGLFFTAKLKEVVILTTETTNIDPSQYQPGKIRNQASATKDSGRQGAPIVTEQESSFVNSYINELKESA